MTARQPAQVRPGCRIDRGVSVIDMSAALAVASVLVGAAVPPLQSSLERRVLEGVASELAVDLRYARTEAVARAEGVRLSVRSNDDGTCVMVHTGAAADCQCGASGAAHCAGDARLLKSSFYPVGADPVITSNVPSMRFDPVNGTVVPGGSVTIRTRGGMSLRHVVSVMGRARTCSPGGSVKGAPAC